MFKKLRIKFIAITMVMVAITMAFAFSAVCISEYQRTNAVVQTALSDAIDSAVSDASRDHKPMRDATGMSREAVGGQSAGNDAASVASASSEDRSANAQKAETTTASYSGSNAQSKADAHVQALPIEQAYAAETEAGENQGDSQQESARESNRQSGEDGQFAGNGNGEYQQQLDSSGAYRDDNASEGQNWANGQSGDQYGDADSESQPNEREGSESGQPAFPSGQGSNAGAFADGSDASGQALELKVDDEDAGSMAPPMIGYRDGGNRTSSSLVPVAVYTVSQDGTLRVVPQVTSASISDDVLKQAAERALDEEDGYRAYDDLDLNVLKRVENDTTYLAFADTSYTKSWMNLALMLAIAGVGTMILFFIVCLFYSRWALKPVREAWDSQRQFVADASHDLKTPLTVILANASILLKHPDHTIASESQWVESTQKEAEDMQGLVNEMLELAQIEAGERIEVEKEDLDFSDLIDGETLLFDSVALERSCAFDCQIEEGVHIVGNEKQIKKMVSTLVENAFKYVDEQGTIEVILRRSGREARLSIRNTGSVISPEDLPHIFDRFYRTDKARTSGTGGFGLGLAIAREIALQHGGDITCKSSTEEGTTFTVGIPVAS